VVQIVVSAVVAALAIAKKIRDGKAGGRFAVGIIALMVMKVLV
jgi:hypothetical protein